MKKIFCILFVLLSAAMAGGADLTGQEILERVDGNFVAENRKITSTMIVDPAQAARNTFDDLQGRPVCTGSSS